MPNIIEGEWSYFLRDPNCAADNPFQSNCTCWCASGTGPHYLSFPQVDDSLTWRNNGTRRVIWPAADD